MIIGGVYSAREASGVVDSRGRVRSRRRVLILTSAQIDSMTYNQALTYVILRCEREHQSSSQVGRSESGIEIIHFFKSVSFYTSTHCKY